MSKFIKGAGGGGSGSGGRAPIEAPNTLQSTQYARILDAVSEGEIEGLVNGLKSVYINNTPLQNIDGTYNFSGVTFDYRTGTQNQGHIPGFPSVENEVPVSTQVTKALPVVRSITNQNIDAVRLTVSVPVLTLQDVNTGDLNGTSVTLQVHLQNNSGGFYPIRLTQESLNLSINDVFASSGNNVIYDASFGIQWIGEINLYSIQYCNWIFEYREIPSGSWTTLQNITSSGSISTVSGYDTPVPPGSVWISDANMWVIPPTSQHSINFNGYPEGQYEFRLTKLSGDGSVKLTSAGAQSYTPNITIEGKTTSSYQRNIRVDLPQPGPWDIRISRVTDDSTSAVLQNDTYWSSYTEIIDTKLMYPNTAVFGVQIDASQFDSIPARAYEIYGIKVKVPSNYNPTTRAYVGEWDGNFKIAWTNNPAWIFYDLVTNSRYGLGDYISPDSVDKWSLYSIGQYCDELVSNGMGAQEPRFVCNAYIQTRVEAYTLLTQMASIFRAMVVWSAGTITCVQDKPKDVDAMFTAANVVNGVFNYSGSSIRARHTVCLVTWNDPSDRYQQKVEYVEDQEGIAQYGVVQTEIQAFGCTSRGQAHRLGRWLLFSERLETETISLRTGLESAMVYPGAIIQTQDSFRSGKRFGGRLAARVAGQEELITEDGELLLAENGEILLTEVAGLEELVTEDGEILITESGEAVVVDSSGNILYSTTSLLQLDSEIEIEIGKSYEISVVLPDGTIESRNITNPLGTHSDISLSSPLSQTPLPYAIWVVAASDLVPEEWRVISVAEVENGIAEITALSSRQDKFDAVEKDLILDPLPTTSIALVLGSVTNITIVESLYPITSSIVGNATTVSWTGSSLRYIVGYTINGETRSTITDTPSHTFNGLVPGLYTFFVQATDGLGRRGPAQSVTREIFGLAKPPANVTNFKLSPLDGSAFLTFDPASDADVRIGGYLKVRHSRASSEWKDSIDVGVAIPGTATNAVVPLLEGTYLAKWVDSTGNESAEPVAIYTDAPSVISLNFIESLVQHPTFTGTKTNVEIGEFGGVPALLLSSDGMGNVYNEGTYLFNAPLDLGAVYTTKVSADLKSYGILYSNLIDTWSNIDSLASIDGGVIVDISANLFIKHSIDGVNYTEWEPLMVGNYSARYMQFKLVLTSKTVSNIAVTECSVNIDMPDVVYSGEDIVSGTSSRYVAYPNQFYSNPALGITAQDMQNGDYYVITNKNNIGFEITFRNSSGSIISKTFDYIAKGY